VEEDPGHHQEEGRLQEEDLGVAEEDRHLQGEGLLLEEEDHLHQEGEADQADDHQDHLPEGQGDLQLGRQEAGLAVQQGAGGIHHLAAQTRPDKQLQQLSPERRQLSLNPSCVLIPTLVVVFVLL